LSASYDASKELIRNELAARIRECLVLRDWNRMEHWARQWIQTEPKSVNGFKWLARASIGLKKHQKAAYAYGRVLDFESSNEEAQKFFTDYPSTLRQDTTTLQKVIRNDYKQVTNKQTTLSREELSMQTLTPESRRELAVKCLELADLYFQKELYAKAATTYKESFDWSPNQSSALGAARAYHQSQQSHHAVHFLRQAIEKQSQWIEGRLLLGKILFEIGQSGEAQRTWQAVLKIESDNKEALKFLRNLL